MAATAAIAPIKAPHEAPAPPMLRTTRLAIDVVEMKRPPKAHPDGNANIARPDPWRAATRWLDLARFGRRPHAVRDNYATHEHAEVRLSSAITRQAIRRGSFISSISVKDLMPAIGAFAASAAPAPQKAEKALIAVPDHRLLTRARAGQYLFHDLTGGFAAARGRSGP
ncbi:MAG TPA: hypothetical protein VF940_30240 [Streptosporangiaceae bacterium]